VEDEGKSETFGRADGGVRDPRRTTDLRSGGRRRPFGCPRPAPNSRGQRRQLPTAGKEHRLETDDFFFLLATEAADFGPGSIAGNTAGTLAGITSKNDRKPR
jgi:hypothetical protein